MNIVVNTKVGVNRGRKRLWLEGKKLENTGFLPGTLYDVKSQNGKLSLLKSAAGRFTISKRKRNGSIQPILDLTIKEFGQMFHENELLRVVISSGKIVVTSHITNKKISERENNLFAKLGAGKQLSTCSLFHGGGVIDRAVHDGLDLEGVGTHIKIAVEQEPDYLESSLRNNKQLWTKDSIVLQSAIEDIVPGDKAPQVDILLAGIPCTGASRSGRAKNKLAFAESHDFAGPMFFHFLKFVEKLNPAICIIENVVEYANTASMEVIRSVLRSLKYDVFEQVLNGTDYGALEKRNRLCVVALSKGISDFGFDLTVPKQSEGIASKISDILEPIALDSDRWKPFDYLKEKAVRDKKQGKNFARQLLSGQESFCGTIGKGYAKCRSTEPFLIHPENPELSRIFTPIEHARLKGIPTDLIGGLSDTTAHEVLGQSVIYPAFVAVAKVIGSFLNGLRPLQIKAA